MKDIKDMKGRGIERRTLLKSLAAVVAVRPVAELALEAQAGALTDAHVESLRAIGEVVLPAALGRDGRERAVTKFVGWVRNYKAGAERGGGYGNAQLGQPTGASPAARYPEQFAALDQAAKDQGAATLAALPVEKRRVVVEAALNTPTRVTQMPARPNGANLIADFMGMFYNGPDGYDLAYNAAIGRDTCRGLEGSDREPERLKGDGGRSREASSVPLD